MRKMSARETRVARAWLPHYKRLESVQIGCIVFGAGLDGTAAMQEAATRYHVVNRGAYATPARDPAPEGLSKPRRTR